jgi:DNA-binding response OmpR family regulator
MHCKDSHRDHQSSAVELPKHHLTFAGFVAEHANDGEEAELLVSELRFDLVILDSRMLKRGPGMTSIAN